MAVRLRQALRADLGSIVDIWVDAFVDDPYFRWIASGDEAYLAFAREWLSFVSNLAFERGHTYLDIAGTVAMAWIPPDLSLVSPADIDRARTIIADHAGAHRSEEAVATIMAARGHDMEQSHWTLQYIGVRSAAWGRGLGVAAVAPMLRRCDDDGVPCGLVSTNERNLTFYRRLGFEVVAEAPTPDGRATLRPMHRFPRPT